MQSAIACCVARQQGGQVCRLATREVGRAVAQRPVAFPTVSLCVARRSGCRGPGGCRNPCPLCVGSRAAMADISGSGEPGRRAGDAGSWDGCSACSCGETCHGLGRTSSCQCGRLGAVVSTRMHPSTQTHPRSNGTAAFTCIVSPSLFSLLTYTSACIVSSSVAVSGWCRGSSPTFCGCDVLQYGVCGSVLLTLLLRFASGFPTGVVEVAQDAHTQQDTLPSCVVPRIPRALFPH